MSLHTHTNKNIDNFTLSLTPWRLGGLAIFAKKTAVFSCLSQNNPKTNPRQHKSK